MSVDSRFTERSCLKNIRGNMIEANTCHQALPCTHKSVRMPGGPRTERCLWQLTGTVAQRCDVIWTKGRGERSCPHNFKKRKHFNYKIQAMIIHRIRHKQQTLVGKFASHVDTKDGDTYIWTHILGLNKWVNKLEALRSQVLHRWWNHI